MLRFAVPVLAFFAIALAATFLSKPSPDELLTQATESFAKIDRGVFDFQVAIAPRGAAAAVSPPASVQLAGPFEIRTGDKLPTARIEYTVSSGGQKQTVTLITTGDKAYTEIQGQAYELPPAALKDLQEAAGGLKAKGKSGGGLAGLNLNFDKWVVDPQVVNGGVVGGQKTWRVDAGVDVVTALRDLITQSKALGSITGSQLPTSLNDKDAETLRKSIKRAFVRIYVGRYDHILRRFDLTMDVSQAGGTASSATAALSGGRANITIAISDPNQSIAVKAPEDPLSYKALQSLTGGATGPTGSNASKSK
ncbi:MAG: hypothetical protein JHC87_03070 [Thermoleophilaceae bacterium]|nr:hypothetical protein [Thermoleophilaceae bacterium]